ncbi:hypothetical protein RUND412_010657 [Rhizina undulata]
MSSQSNSPVTLHNDSIGHSTGADGGSSPFTLSSPPSVLEPPVGFEHLEWENEYEEELEYGEKTDSNESIDVEDREFQTIDSADMPMGVSGGADTTRCIKKRKLGRYENNTIYVRPYPSIPHMEPPPAPKRTANGELVDPRIFDGVLQMINGMWMVPRTCNACKNASHFCNRNSPCEKCAKAGRACIRDEGFVPARCRSYRLSKSRTSGPNPIPASAANSSSASADLLGTGNRKFPKNPTRRRHTAHKSTRAREDGIEPEPTIMEDVQAGKPPCIGRPPAWCDSRQELCETLPYFRSYQSGCYHQHGLIFGYLLDGFGAPRDYIDGRVIVAHAGGKSGIDGDGKRVLLSDQTIDDSAIKSMINNMRSNFPVAIIMGNQCAYSPAQIPHRYCVMDWFKVVAAWGERDSASTHIRYKFRYEKLDTSTDGWWADRTTVEKPEQLLWKVCDKCKQSSMHIYEQGWMCVIPECPLFWTIDGNDPPENLTYTANFMNGRTPWPSEICIPPTPLAPPVVSHASMYDGGDVTRMFWRGMCCPQCGRCNSREFYDSWRCLACAFRIEPPRTIFEPSRLLDPHRPIFTGPAMPSNIVNDDIRSISSVTDGLTVIQYTLGDCGTVTHILANTRSNAGPYDADWLLREYQNPKLPFRRYPMQNHHATGRLLTRHFSFNCGKPYKFVVDVDSMPFDEAPEVVNKALELIHKRVGLVYPDAEFNEILSVGYFQQQKMGYHDDGEAEIGDTVASISLGAPSRFRFRLKRQYVHETQRWKSDVNARKKKGKGSGRVKLDLLLSHGDTVIMRGRDIQKYWEHSAEPSGLFRIAVTARQITDS